MVLAVKTVPASAGDTGDVGLIPGWGRYTRVENGTAVQLFLPAKFHEQRSLMDHRVAKSQTWLSTYIHTYIHTHIHGYQGALYDNPILGNSLAVQ